VPLCCFGNRIFQIYAFDWPSIVRYISLFDCTTRLFLFFHVGVLNSLLVTAHMGIEPLESEGNQVLPPRVGESLKLAKTNRKCAIADRT
jgi:hypothetical protein